MNISFKTKETIQKTKLSLGTKYLHFIKSKYKTLLYESNLKQIDDFQLRIYKIIDKEYDFLLKNQNKAFEQCRLLIEKAFLEYLTKKTRENLCIYNRNRVKKTEFIEENPEINLYLNSNYINSLCNRIIYYDT